nr:hypothetical protein [Tanacetum cinerariifolium]
MYSRAGINEGRSVLRLRFVLLRFAKDKVCQTQNCIAFCLRPNGEALRKCILSGPYKPTTILVEAVEATDDSPAIPEHTTTTVANNTSGLIPQRQKASDYDNPDPVPQRQDVSSLADADVPSQQELDLLFGPLYDEFFNAGSNPQDKQPSTNIQSTSAPSTPTNVQAEENNNNQAKEGEQLQDDEFTNPFCAPAHKEAESSSHNIGNSNVPTFNQPQLVTYPEMCMYALTVSTAEPKNIKETMADSAWIEAMQKELHQFDRLQVWELVDKPFGKMVIKIKCTQFFSNLSYGRENGISKWSTKEEVYVAQPDGFVDPDHPEKVYRLRKALYGLKQDPSAWYDELSKFLTSKGFAKGQSIGTTMATKPKLDADLSGNPVDQTDYRSKIGSLMYLTSSRPDIVQAVCFYARYQSRTTEKHLKEVKRIFRYLGGTINIAFLDVDHAGCIDSRKITSGGIKFLGDKLVSWMSKKHNCTAMSLVEAEYVALSASCAQVMWMRTQLQDYGFN